MYEMLPALKDLYGDFLKPELESVAIIVENGTVQLSVRHAGGSHVQNLAFFAGEDMETSLFDAGQTEAANAHIFLEKLDHEDINQALDLFNA